MRKKKSFCCRSEREELRTLSIGGRWHFKQKQIRIWIEIVALNIKVQLQTQENEEKLVTYKVQKVRTTHWSVVFSIAYTVKGFGILCFMMFFDWPYKFLTW